MNGGGRDWSKWGTRDYVRGISYCDWGPEGNYAWYTTRVNEVPDPSHTLLLVELREDNFKQNVMSGGPNGVSASRNHPYDQQNRSFNELPWHNGSWNYLFCDGRVAGLDPAATVGTGGFGYNAETDANGMWTRAAGD